MPRVWLLAEVLTRKNILTSTVHSGDAARVEPEHPLAAIQLFTSMRHPRFHSAFDMPKRSETSIRRMRIKSRRPTRQPALRWVELARLRTSIVSCESNFRQTTSYRSARGTSSIQMAIDLRRLKHLLLPQKSKQITAMHTGVSLTPNPTDLRPSR